MNMNDKEFSKKYSDLFDNVYASSELRERIIAMSEKNEKKKSVKTLKFVYVAAVAAALIIAGSIGVYAKNNTAEQYETVSFNGNEISARYARVYHNSVFDFTEDGNRYFITVYGDYDKETDTLYVDDKGSYAIASIEPDAQLNLYTDIQNVPNAEIVEENGEVLLKQTYEDGGWETYNLTDDEADGKKDGVIVMGKNSCESFSITSDGRIVNTSRSKSYNILDTINKELDNIWESLWEVSE